MFCENCGKNYANVKYTKIINGEKTEIHLCDECSTKMGIQNFNIPIEISSFFSDFFDEIENDINYMLITTKASTDKKQAYHVLDAVNIYNYYFENYKYHTILEKGKLLTTIKVKDSKLEEIKIENKNEIKKYLKNDYNTDDIKIEYEGKEEVNFKDKKGDKLGVVKLYYQDKEVNSIDIYLEEEIKFNLFSHILQSKIRISLLGVIFVGIILLIIKKGAKI